METMKLAADVFAFVAIIFAAAVVAAVASHLPIGVWIRREVERARMKTWAPTGERPGPCSVKGDPRVQAMVVKQRAFGKRLRRQGRTLLAGKEYVPALTKPAEPPAPPMADKVVPIRRGVKQ